MNPRAICWWCGAELIWDNDFTSDDVFGDGEERLVTFLHCSNPKSIPLHTTSR